MKKDYPSLINVWLKENPWKGKAKELYYKQHLARYLDTLNIIERHVSKNSNMLCIGCDPGHIEFLMVCAIYKNIDGISCNIAPPLADRLKGIGINLYNYGQENFPVLSLDIVGIIWADSI